MRRRNSPVATLAVSITTLALCCSVNASADRRNEGAQERISAYTGGIVAQVPAVVLGDAATPPEELIPRETGLESRNPLNLRLLQYAWDSTAIFGRIVSQNATNELKRFLAQWVRVPGPSSRADRQDARTAYLPATSRSRAGQDARRFLPGPYGTDWEGRMPSLAASMASPYDTTMGLDDVERGPDPGVRFGLRVVWPPESVHSNAPIAIEFVGPGF